jgi:aspartyl-tRNA synthetase
LVVLSADPSDLPLPLRDEQDLGATYRLRYRYTGLRLLLERGGRY